MEVIDLINAIVNNGFAIAVAEYLLMRLEKQIANLSLCLFDKWCIRNYPTKFSPSLNALKANSSNIAKSGL